MFNIEIKGGLVAPEALAGVIADTMGDALQLAATAVGVALIDATPRRTGAMAGDWHILTSPQQDGTRLITLVYNQRDYADEVEEEGRHAGFVLRTLDEQQAAALSALATGLPALATRLWLP